MGIGKNTSFFLQAVKTQVGHCESQSLITNNGIEWSSSFNLELDMDLQKTVGYGRCMRCRSRHKMIYMNCPNSMNKKKWVDKQEESGEKRKEGQRTWSWERG